MPTARAWPFRPRSIPVASVLFVGSLMLHTQRLGTATGLHIDEVLFGLTAQSLATTGRDLWDRFLPLYFPMGPLGRDMWFSPFLFYVLALAAKVLPFSEATIRLPMAVFGAADIALIFLAGTLLFETEVAALAAAVLLALSPAHLIYARVALDFQAPVTFALGWLVCVLAYRRTDHAGWLAAASLLLGVGLYSHVSSWYVMPACAVATCAALYLRRERLSRYVVFAIFFLPAVAVEAAFLLTHRAVLSQVVSHYQGDLPIASGGFIDTFAAPSQVADTISRFGRFFGPRFLFIDGPFAATWHAGVFLLPTAGLIAAAIVRIVRRPSRVPLLLLVAVLLAPLPASALGEREAIRRALTMVPLGVLLAAAGLEYVWMAESKTERRILSVVIWAVAIGLCFVYRPHLFRAQAFIRASTVPLIIVGLALVLGRADIERRRWLAACSGVVVLLIAQAVDASIGESAIVSGSSVLLGMLCAAAVIVPDSGARSTEIRVIAAVALLALIASQFTYFYIDFKQIPPVPLVPPEGVRIIAAAVAFATVTASAALAKRMARSDPPVATLGAASAVILLAYFHADAFTDYRLRFIYVMAMLAAGVWVATSLGTRAISRRHLWQLATASVVALSAVQFGYFYREYLIDGRFHDQSQLAWRRAWQTVVERARERNVPTICVPQTISRVDLLYARFHLLSGDRHDLIDRMVRDCPDLPSEVDRVRALPAGSVLITNASANIDAAIEALAGDGVIQRPDLVMTPSGTPMYWVVQRAAS